MIVADDISPGVSLNLEVVPGASRSEIAGWLGEALKVRVSAPSEQGKANATVEELLARNPGLPRSAVAIVGGHGSIRKTVQIAGMDAAAVRKKLAKPDHE